MIWESLACAWSATAVVHMPKTHAPYSCMFMMIDRVRVDTTMNIRSCRRAAWNIIVLAALELARSV